MSLDALSHAEQLDAEDPLAPFKDRFEIGDPDLIYLDGNSLGRLSTATARRLHEVIHGDWGRGLIESWDFWMDWPVQVGDRIAAHVVGARPGEVIVSDNTTVNFYKLAVAALDARPGRRAVIIDRHNFPTDRFVIEGLAAQRGLEIRWIEGDPIEGVQTADVEAVLDDDVAFVTLSHLEYRCGAIADLPAITAAAHAVGALVLWDLSHSGGSLPVDLEAHGVDLAVGCSYKYLNGGPGAPAYLYVRASLQEEIRQPIWGWIGARDVFAMAPAYERGLDARQYLTGTPSVFSLAAIDEGVTLIAEAGLGALRTKGQALTSYAIALHDEWLAPLGFSIGSPRDAQRRGSHVSLRHPDAKRLCNELRARKVIPDFREPDSIRLGLAPLTTSHVDVWRALVALRELVA